MPAFALAFWSEVAEAFWSELLAVAAFVSALLLAEAALLASVLVLVEGVLLWVAEAALFWSVAEFPATPVELVAGAEDEAVEVEVELWSGVVPAAGAAELAVVVLEELCAELLLWSGVVVLAVVEPEPTLLGEVWLLTGGFALAAEPVVEALWAFISLELVLVLGAVEALELGVAEELAEDWSVELGVFMLLDEPVLALAGALVSAEVPLAEAELLLHESEIMLIEVTFREPPPLLSPPERVP